MENDAVLAEAEQERKSEGVEIPAFKDSIEIPSIHFSAPALKSFQIRKVKNKR